MRKISICIPTFNRYELLLQSYHDVIGDERVGEIVISDDASDLDIFKKIQESVRDEPKIKLHRNLSNADCYRNKMVSLSLATNDWCIILDSDNIIGRDYLDKLYEFEEWMPHIVYQPDFAKPTFDFRAFSGLPIWKENVAKFMGRKMFDTMLNAMNYFVNRYEYLKVWDGSVDPVTADSIYQNYNWLNAGNKILVVDGLQYFHRVHHQSHYIVNNHRTNGFYEVVVNNLKNLK